MKTILTVILSVVAVLSGSAQDTLIKKNGDTLSISVIELTEDALIYTKTDESKDKIFTTPLSKLKVLLYADGRTEDLLTDKVTLEIKKDSLQGLGFPTLKVRRGFWGPYISSGGKKYANKKLSDLYHKTDTAPSMKLHNLGQVSNFTSIFFAFASGYGITNGLIRVGFKRAVFSDLFFVGGISAIFASVGLQNHSVVLFEKSIAPYNEVIETRFGLTNDGVGLSMIF